MAKDETRVLSDGICGAGVPVHTCARLVGMQDRQPACSMIQAPRTAVCEVSVQRARPVLCDHADALDPRIEAAREGEIDQAVFARKG